MTEQEMVALARGKLGSLRELETLLKKRGMQSVIRQPGDGKNCNTGWGVTLELAVASADLADGMELMQDSWKESLTPEEIAATEMVVDFDAEQTTCPACMTIFTPETPMCPGCGLRFG